MKTREKGLFLDPKWHESPFAGILLGINIGHNGAKVSHPIMTISITAVPNYGDTFGIGTKTYMFVAVAAVGDQIYIPAGATAADVATAIINKINADSKVGTGCTAYAIGSLTLILLIDNLAETDTASPTFTDDLPEIAEDAPWMNVVPDHWLIDTNYLAIEPTTDSSGKSPIVLTTQRNGGPGSPSYQNFLY
jgi:hypothetical protein